MWDMMSRGSFNGPGGQHARYLIPPTQGAALGSQHNVRNKRVLNFLTDDDLLRLNRDGLAQSGMAVADVTAREVAPTGGEISRRQHRARRHRRQRGAVQRTATRPRTATACRAHGQRHDHRQVQQLHDGGRAADRLGLLRPGPRRPDLQDEEHRRRPAAPSTASCGSSTPTRRTSTRSTSSRPDGTPKLATLGDERQKNDALVQRRPELGLARTSTRTPPNRLHFYIIDKRTDADGHPALQGRRQVARRRRPADARRQRSRRPQLGNAEGYTTCTFNLKNTGAAAATPNVHPQDASAFLDQRRLPALGHRRPARAGARTSRTRSRRPSSASRSRCRSTSRRAPGAGTVTLNAVSESDPTKTASAVCTLADASVGGSVPATLALTMGAPASFGPFTPGLGKDYFASTSANVISTAGDATLSVADPATTRHRPPGQRHVLAAAGAAGRPAHGGTYAPSAARRPDDAEDLRRPGLQRPGDGQLQAADRLHGRAAHRHATPRR